MGMKAGKGEWIKLKEAQSRSWRDTDALTALFPKNFSIFTLVLVHPPCLNNIFTPTCNIYSFNESVSINTFHLSNALSSHSELETKYQNLFAFNLWAAILLRTGDA